MTQTCLVRSDTLFQSSCHVHVVKLKTFQPNLAFTNNQEDHRQHSQTIINIFKGMTEAF